MRRFLFPFLLILPLIISLGAYWYCMSSACETKKEQIEESQSKEHKADIHILVAAISKKKNSKTSADNPIDSQTPPSCSMPCDVIKNTTSDPVALFTAVLCYIVLLQLIWMSRQEGVLKESVAVADKAANAAERQSKAAIATELPILRIIDLKLAEFDRSGNAVEGNDPVPAGPLSGLYKILFCYKNVGRTMATVNKIIVEYRLTQFLPEQPQYQDAKLVWLPFDVEPQSSSWFPWVDMLKLSDEEIHSINTKNAFLWIYGIVKYTDFMGDTHESRFLGFWDAIPRQPQTDGIVFGIGLEQYKTNT